MTIKKTTVSDEENQVKPVQEDEIVVPPEGADIPQKAAAVESAAAGLDVEVEEEAQFPSAFYCPITKKVMVDPVVHPSGESYEKEAVMQRESDKELVTFYPNRALKAYIESQLARTEDEGSVRGTLRKLDDNLRSGWDKFVEKAALPLGETRPLPDEFYCTLTLDLPHEPIIDPDGYTYEREALVHWVNNNGDSPVTRKPLTVDQLYDNNAVLSILLEEAEKPDDAIHPCIRRWKEEFMSPSPSIVPQSGANNDAVGGGGIPMNGTTTQTGVRPQVYPTTHAEMEERMRREHRVSMFSLILIIVIISFALIYLPFYLVVFALAFCSCLYARRRFHERQHQQHR